MLDIAIGTTMSLLSVIIVARILLQIKYALYLVLLQTWCFKILKDAKQTVIWSGKYCKCIALII